MISPQLRYMRQVRQDPLVRELEGERQRQRRSTKQYRHTAAIYARAWRARQKTKRILGN